jgi:type IV pilus assembly protein PilW
MKSHHRSTHQRGFTLVELLVSIVITLFVVAAAGYVYVNTRDTQRAIETSSASAEAGSYAMQLIGRDLLNAGAYPSIMPPVTANFPTRRQFDNYPPIVGIPARDTDWIVPKPAYGAPIFGCEGANFDPVSGTCGPTVAGAPDSLVINYFTSDTVQGNSGQRLDCTGANVDADASNAKRKLNTGGTPPTASDPNLPPQLPLFGSNRYVLTAAVTTIVDGFERKTRSLACAGNGAKDPTAFAPILSGIEDMQLTYGVYGSDTSRAPDQYYSADKVEGTGTKVIDGIALSPWARVVSVRVCLMTRTLISAKIADATGKRQYVDCAGNTVTQAANDVSLYRRYEEVFSLRNRMNQTF